MNLYVTTSDWYNPMLPAFAHLFNRHWSRDQPVSVLGYTRPDLPLPDNFAFVPLGDPGELGGDGREWSRNPRWTDSLRPFFEALEDRHFILMQIDYFIHFPVDLDRLDRLLRYRADEGVVKIDLSPGRSRFRHRPYATENGLEVILSEQDTSYRSALQAALWERDYFLGLLKPNRDPWQFERLGMEEVKNDGKLILGVKGGEHAPVPYLNVYSKGKMNWGELGQLREDLLDELFRLGLIGQSWNGWEPPPETSDRSRL